ncbi:hypothetical protein B0H11DRAFT_2243351 [Mycena galericulata]|nr:hypothetical protein B0H11DRAFT_2243351 [Mycena galericulata]
MPIDERVLRPEPELSSSANTLTVNTSTGSYTSLIYPQFPNTRRYRSVAFAKPPVTPRALASPPCRSPTRQPTTTRTTIPVLSAVRLGAPPYGTSSWPQACARQEPPLFRC